MEAQDCKQLEFPQRYENDYHTFYLSPPHIFHLCCFNQDQTLAFKSPDKFLIQYVLKSTVVFPDTFHFLILNSPSLY